MEAIKCPNCGSEKIKELTEEKYACLACDNNFLVHNLSKEFCKTDEHITTMHEDIKNAIEEVKIQSNNRIAELNAVFENAFHLITIEKYDLALEKFKKLCVDESVTYQSWWGKFLARTKNLQLVDEEIICSTESIECIKNMRQCKDYTQEIEVKLCDYLNSVFNRNRMDVERALKQIKEQIEKMESKEKEVENEAKRVEYEKGNLFQIQKRLKKLNSTQKLVTKIGIILAEMVVAYIFFVAWLGKSIEIMRIPVDEISFGTAILNLLSIPVKCILGIIVMGVVGVKFPDFVRYIYALLGKNSENEMAISIENIKTMETNQNEWFETINANKRTQHDLEKHLELYSELDFKDLSTLKKYGLLMGKYQNKENEEFEEESEETVTLCITSIGKNKEAFVQFLEEDFEWEADEIETWFAYSPNILMVSNEEASDIEQKLRELGVDVHIAEDDEFVFLEISSLGSNEERIINYLNGYEQEELEETRTYYSELPAYIYSPMEVIENLYKNLLDMGAEVTIKTREELEAK